MKPVLIAAAGAAVLAATAACSADWGDYEYTPASGIITELEYEEAETTQTCGTEYVLDPVTGQYKNKQVCRTAYKARCYEVEFETPEGNLIEDCTTKAMFDQLEVGMVYTEEQEALATSTPWLTPSPSGAESASG